jgi:hypothetical protein
MRAKGRYLSLLVLLVVLRTMQRAILLERLLIHPDPADARIVVFI